MLNRYILEVFRYLKNYIDFKDEKEIEKRLYCYKEDVKRINGDITGMLGGESCLDWFLRHSIENGLHIKEIKKMEYTSNDTVEDVAHALYQYTKHRIERFHDIAEFFGEV